MRLLRRTFGSKTSWPVLLSENGIPCGISTQQVLHSGSKELVGPQACGKWDRYSASAARSRQRRDSIVSLQQFSAAPLLLLRGCAARRAGSQLRCGLLHWPRLRRGFAGATARWMNTGPAIYRHGTGTRTDGTTSLKKSRCGAWARIWRFPSLSLPALSPDWPAAPAPQPDR